MHKNTLPSQAKLKELVDYDPISGRLTRRSNGKPALNCINGRGHRHGTLQGTWLYAHRVIWKWMTGEEPDEVDHIDRNKGNNKWGNLRSVCRGVNTHNSARSDQSTSKTCGVCWDQGHQKWRAQLHHDGKQLYLGLFKTEEAAAQARKAKERELGLSYPDLPAS